MLHHTKILGVPVNADPEVIKKAYRDLVRSNHPDIVGQTAEATERMKEINAAYKALTSGETLSQQQPQQNTGAQAGRPFKQYEDFSYQSSARPRSPFGNRRAQREAEEKAAAEAAEKKRQEQAWTRDQKTMRQRGQAGRDDWQQAQESVAESTAGMTDAERRAAELRALRQRRAERREGVNTYGSAQTSRAERAYQQGARMGEDDRGGIEVIGGFSRKKLSTVITSDQQDRALDAKLDEMRDNEARKAVANRRAGKPTAQPGSFHKAQMITYENGMVNIFLGSRGLQGRNIIAAPSFTQTADNSVRMGKDVQAFAMTLNKDGKQSHEGAESLLIKNGRGMKIAVHFSDAPQNLRAQTRQNNQAR